MAKLRFLWENQADYADVSASTETYGNEATNTQTQHTSELWLTDATQAAETLTWDAYSAVDVQACVILNHDLSDSDSNLQIAGNTADSWGAPAFTKALTMRDTALVEFFVSEQSYRYWRYSFTKVAANQQRQCARVYLGPYYECTRNPRWGWQPNAVDASSLRRSPYGPAFVDIRGQYERIEMPFALVPQVQATEMMNLVATLGIHGTLFLSGDHDNYPVDWLWYGRLTDWEYSMVRPDPDGGYFWNFELAMETEA